MTTLLIDGDIVATKPQAPVNTPFIGVTTCGLCTHLRMR